MRACPKCAYNNADDALVCNLCGAVLKPAARPGATRHVLQPVGSPPRPLEAGKVLTIGRAPDAGLVVNSNRVSRYHAEVRWEGGAPVLVDRGSANGTFVNGARVTVHALRSGDEIEIGPFFCTYVLEGAARPAPAPEANFEGGATQVVTFGGALEGQIDEVSVAEVLQSIELNEKTGTLEVQSPAGSGWIAVQDGRPLAASFGGRADDDAAVAMILLATGRFSFKASLEVWDRRMTTTVTGLLLEAGRRRDEAAAAAAAAAAPAPEAVGEETQPLRAPRGAVAAGSGSDDLLARATAAATRTIKRLDRFYLAMPAKAWATAKAGGRIEPPAGQPLRLCSAGQLVRTANRFFRGQGALEVLVVDPRLSTHPIRWEDPGDGQRVPTLHGFLPVGAVVATHPLLPGPDGAFATPDWLAAE